jgi:HELP motif
MEEDPLFEEVDESSEQFMAVRPWLGQIAEPDNHNVPNPSAPDVQYKLEYVYGYRSADTRQNVKYNSNKNIVYMTAALGVVLN